MYARQVAVGGGEAGGHFWTHRRVELAVVLAEHEDAIDVVDRVPLRLVFVQPGQGFAAASRPPQVVRRELCALEPGVERRPVRVVEMAPRAENTADQEVDVSVCTTVLAQGISR
ncbi:hypothetical protein AB5L52_00045 [Streptomyces sp. CG4]|uniref:hypothetical protein n=1 Tax=Streptomyces sp. CG4 TaxID=408783 RepID=UPI0034E21010